MKLIRLFSIISMVMVSVFSSVALAQDLSATRPRRVKDVEQQVPTDRVESKLAYNANTSDPDSSSTVMTPWVQIQKTVSPASVQAARENFAHVASAVVRSLPQQRVEIIWPRPGDTVYVESAMMSVRVDPSVNTLSVVVKKDDKEVFNSGSIELARVIEGNVWKGLIRLAPGSNTITVTATDSSNPPPGQLTATVTVVQQGDTSAPDERGGFEASAFVGYAIDTFAASDLRRYLNPNDSGGVTERFVGGFDFAYRLFGDSTKRTQLWVYGETVHGVRSTDVDCEANPELAVCKDLFDPTNVGDATLFILRNATSLEAFAGFRYEFKTLNPTSDYAANLYLKGQLGFLTVAGGGDDVVDVHHVALGAIATKGRHKGSYLEAGFGKTDLFQEHRNRRFKVDGFLSWELPGALKNRMRPFAQMTVDSDFGPGADSIQSYFGVDFDVVCLFRLAKDKDCSSK